MNNFFEKLENDLAYSKASRGEGTGPTSRILSNVNILLIVYLLIVLLKAHFYLPAILLLLLGFTRFSHWSFIGFIIYFIFVRYWPGIFIMAISGTVGWISAWVGMNNIKKNLYSDKAKVDPFEGMNDLLIILIFQVIFFVLALITSGFLSVIFWVLFTIVTLFEISRYYHRLSSPWRGIHYPLMVRYAWFVGIQTGIAKKTEKEFDKNAALKEFVKNIYPDWSEEEINNFIDSVNKKVEKFDDREKLIDAFKKNNPSLEDKKLGEVLDNFQEHLKKQIPRAVIAEIIERDFGIDEKIKYLYAGIIGRAN